MENRACCEGTALVVDSQAIILTIKAATTPCTENDVRCYDRVNQICIGGVWVDDPDGTACELVGISALLIVSGVLLIAGIVLMGSDI